MQNSIRYSLAHLTVLDLSPPEVARVAAEAGFDAFGLRLHPVRPGESPPPIHGDTPMRRELLSVMHDTGVRMFDVEAFRLHRSVDFHAAEQALEAAARFGAQIALCFIDESEPGKAAELFGRFCDLAAGYKLDAALEYMPWLGINSLSSALAVIEASSRSNARLLLDSLHVARTRTKLAEIAELDADLMRYVQICDAPVEPPPTLEAIAAEARFERQFPGEGHLSLTEFLAVLPPDLVISPEIATAAIASTVSGLDRARHALLSTRKVVEMARRSGAITLARS